MGYEPEPRRVKIDKRRRKDKMLEELVEYFRDAFLYWRERKDNPHAYFEDTARAGKADAFLKAKVDLEEILEKGRE